MKINDLVHRIDEVRGANCYLYILGSDALLVDTGMPNNGKKIIDYIKGIGLSTNQLRYIVLTHADIDHSGSASELKELTGAKLAVHENDVPRVAGTKKLKEVGGAAQLLLDILGVFIRYKPVNPDIILHDSDALLDLKIIHTPGHTDGSICIYKENQLIFVGDVLRVASDGTPRLPPLSKDPKMVRESIKKISSLSYSSLLPGHGPPILFNASEKVLSLVEKFR